MRCVAGPVSFRSSPALLRALAPAFKVKVAFRIFSNIYMHKNKPSVRKILFSLDFFNVTCRPSRKLVFYYFSQQKHPRRLDCTDRNALLCCCYYYSTLQHDYKTQSQRLVTAGWLLSNSCWQKAWQGLLVSCPTPSSPRFLPRFPFPLQRVQQKQDGGGAVSA